MPDASRPLPESPAALAGEAGWRARLALGFTCEDGHTRLTRRGHEGPLVVQRPLYPEGEGVCQCIIVHPPGGIAGGDRLALTVDVGPRAHAQLTTPGAAKWYRSGGKPAEQQIHFRVADGAVLEWLPHGGIVFDDADATTTARIELEGGAAYVGWDVVCLGRTASAERFRTGGWRQRVDIVRDGALVWSERLSLRGGAKLLISPAGLNGAPVFGTFVVMAATIDDPMLAACRGLAPAEGHGTVTRLPGALVARYRGDATEAAHDYFAALWTTLRPHAAGRAAVRPRIWRT
ncbi:MAG: urease accessory protein UreD [Casimicrobiaceae bacterium]